MEKQSNYRDNQIKGFIYIDGIRITVLKMGVTRKNFRDSINPDELESHINNELHHLEQLAKYRKIVVGEDDFEN